MKLTEKEQIFTKLFVENRDKVYRLCNAYLNDKNVLDDLFQDIMINIWNNLHSFRQEAKISTWIYRIAVNTALMYNNKIKKKNNLFSEFDLETLKDHRTNDDASEKGMIFAGQALEMDKQSSKLVGFDWKEVKHLELIDDSLQEKDKDKSVDELIGL